MKIASISLSTIILTGLLNMGCSNSNKNTIDNTKNKEQAFDLTEIKKTIEEKNNQFTKAHITRDTAFLNNIFTKDAKVFAPNSEVVIGRSAIAAVNWQWVNFGIKEFREDIISLYGNEDYLISEGSYYLIYGKENTLDKGKYLNVWKKEDGEWKIFSNIWNTNLQTTSGK